MNDADPDDMCFDCIADETFELIDALKVHGARLVVEHGQLRLYATQSRTVPVSLVRRVQRLRGPIAAVIAAEQHIAAIEEET